MRNPRPLAVPALAAAIAGAWPLAPAAAHAGARAQAPAPRQVASPQAVERRIDALLARMTLREKIGQMTQVSEGNNLTGPGGVVGLEASVAAGDVGSVLNAMGVERTRALQQLAVEKTRLGIPLIFGLDVIHGYKTTFPIPLAEACSWDLPAIERAARAAATEAAADGQHWTFAPMVDIARDPRWGRIAEGAGEDVYLGCQIARARVRGFQGKDLLAHDSLVATVKHFAAYGASMAGRDYNTVDLSRRTLLETYLPPYRAAVDAGARTVMSSFNDVDGVPASANRWLMADTLKRQWGFTGFVVSDWSAIMEMVHHGHAADLKDAARLSARAGMDMDMMGNAFLQHLPALARERQVAMARLDDAVRRILRVKFEKGLFDDPYRASDAARRDRALWAPAHLDAALDIARKSIVLLKNERGALPLRPGQTVALVGPLAANRDDMMGSWPGPGDPKRCRTVLEGLDGRGLKVLHAEGCTIEGTDRGRIHDAVRAARRADVVVAVVGEAALMSGEAASRADIGLPGVQRELVAALAATGKPLVLVSMSGRPLTLTAEDAQADAVVQAWHLGMRAGDAVADVLTGAFNPSGRLAATFPRHVGQIPLFYDHFSTGRPFEKGQKYTTQYLDVPNDPLYPFGHGLSYTRFEYAPLRLSTSLLAPGGKVRVETTVRNAGDRDGDEVAQLYVRDRIGSVNRPVRQLKGFRKLRLAKGEAATVAFELTPRDLAFYRQDMSFGAEAGDFDVWIGPSSAVGPKATFRLTRDVAVKEFAP